jgi:hypothetical protein
VTDYVGEGAGDAVALVVGATLGDAPGEGLPLAAALGDPLGDAFALADAFGEALDDGNSSP